MNKIIRRYLLIVSSVAMFSWCSSSCDFRDHSGKPRTILTNMDAVDGRILNLFESGAIKRLGSYSGTNDVIVRFIESSPQSVIEITITSNDTGAMCIVWRCLDYRGKDIESSNREMSQSETAKLNIILENIRRVKYEIALSADPKAIGTGDYLIEFYHNGGHVAYLRAGYSASFPGDMEDIRKVLLQMVWPVNR